MFEKILIANRGEIAVRIIKTARRMGIATVAVHSDADAASLAVSMADEAVRIGPAAATLSYLDAEAVIAAAKATGAQAVHPGYGFLSERAAFAERLAAEGIVFIGPNPRAIEAMGDKIESKRFAAAAKVSTVPGSLDVISGTAHAVKVAEVIGYPVMMKASAGGGGKGMRIAWTRAEVEEGFTAAQAEARGAFGDDRVFIEKFVSEPRHIEIQVLGDRHGHVVHLNERECSIQRRHQKVIEEAPSPFVTPAMRAAMGAQAVALAKAVDYDSAGTVEFIVDADRRFYFLEMNTRLQVEHPVTELTTGLDLVEQMIRVAAGEPLSFGQEDVRLDGWAVESRIYAEDPYRGFLPSIGRLSRYAPPPEGTYDGVVVRNDTGVGEGDDISVHYDPMIAKLCTWAETRDAALDGMARALDGFRIEGPANNILFLSAVVDEARFRSGKISTAYIAETWPDGFHGLEPTAFQADAMTAAALAMQRLQGLRNGNGKAFRSDWVVSVGTIKRPLQVRVDGAALEIAIPGERRTLRLDGIDWRPGGALFRGVLDGKAFGASVAPAAEGFQIRMRAATARVLALSPRSSELHERLPPRKPKDRSNRLVSPMPGVIVALHVVPGQAVKAGETVAVIEAMKMQNMVRAERDGTAATVDVAVGDSVAADQVLATLA